MYTSSVNLEITGITPSVSSENVRSFKDWEFGVTTHKKDLSLMRVIQIFVYYLRRIFS